MRLKKEQITRLSQKLLNTLQNSEVAHLKVSHEKVLAKVNEIITDEMLIEVKLDEEVRKMMEKFQGEIKSGRIDGPKMFQMIKKQLIKERDLVI